MMDDYIAKNSKGQQIAVSYTSLENTLDQFHRNANLTSPASELLKAPFLFASLVSLVKKQISWDDSYEISLADIQKNGNGMIGEEDEGKVFNCQELLQALIHFGDNAAVNILQKKVNPHQYFETFGVHNMYMKIPMVDSLVNSTLGIKNQASTADLVNFQKYIYLYLKESKKGVKLLNVLKQENKIAQNQFLNSVEKDLFYEESSDFLKGFTVYANGRKPYVLSLIIMNFKGPVLAAKSLEEITALFVENYR